VYRFAQGNAERFPALASELVNLPVDVIVSWGTPAGLAAHNATDTIPIVMSAGNPIGAGIVAGLARPGRNVTGMSVQMAEQEGKRLELLKKLLPSLSRVAVLSNPSNPYCAIAVGEARIELPRRPKDGVSSLYPRASLCRTEGGQRRPKLLALADEVIE
jgi:putative tryptophan/tyrosine transport system substrate-binding protein